MAMGWRSPALPTNVYERSNPFGPSTFISQSSFARDPTIDTRQSPGLPLRTCSTIAWTSGPIATLPILCSSTKTAISCIFYRDCGSRQISSPSIEAFMNPPAAQEKTSCGMSSAGGSIDPQSDLLLPETSRLPEGALVGGGRINIHDQKFVWRGRIDHLVECGRHGDGHRDSPGGGGCDGYQARLGEVHGWVQL
jgi:hypothetical protein